MKTTVRGCIAAALIASLAMTACGERGPEGPAAEVASPRPAAEAQVGDVPTITYVSEPDPPRAGDNAVSVLVRDADGSAIADLTVTATYFMPAMPSMNMPEMRDSFTLIHQGEGKYAGNVRLSMGGTWTVTVMAKRGEESVARKLLNIVARE